MKPVELKFKNIDLISDRESIIEFRRDSFVVSFKSESNLVGEDGQGIARYLEILKKRSEELPGSCVSVYDGDKLVGQVELRFSREDREMGYVNLFYLIPEYRNMGLGSQLDAYAKKFFSSHGICSAFLKVSTTNAPGIKFYTKNRWIKKKLKTEGNNIIYILEKYYD